MVWPSRRLRTQHRPAAPATWSTAPASLGLVGDRGDDLAGRRILALPLPRRLRPALDRDRAGGRGAGPPGRRGSGRSSAAGRCAGSASAPTASTSGTCRSSSSPPPSGAHAAELAARRCSRSRRPSASPRSPGASSRTRSATAPSAASGSRCASGAIGAASVTRGGWALGRGLRGWSSRSRSPASPGSASTSSRSAVGSTNGRRRRSPPTTARQAAAGDHLQRGRPHRRLDLGGPGLDPEYLPRRASGSPPSTRGSGRRPRTSRSPARARSTRTSKANRTPRKRREAWKNEGFKGCWVLAMGTNEAANVAAGSNVHLRRHGSTA